MQLTQRVPALILGPFAWTHFVINGKGLMVPSVILNSEGEAGIKELLLGGWLWFWALVKDEIKETRRGFAAWGLSRSISVRSGGG